MSSERVNQKQRTRAALLKAARDLMVGETSVTLQAIADHAAISRATAYRYYSDLEVLLQEAALDGIAEQIEQFKLSDPGDADMGVEARLVRTVERILDMVLENEAMFRIFLRGVVAGDNRPERGARRLRWLADALGLDRQRFPDRIADRLIQALALLTGIETVIVTRDVCGLNDADTRELVRWTASALLRASLEEAASAATVSPAAS